MTAQIPDSFLTQGKIFSIAGVNGGSLFHPAEYDLQPLPRITSCWRGYGCVYKTLEDKLVLERLQVNLGHAGPQINQVQPLFSNQGAFDNIYNQMNLPIDFTGGLLVADGFIRELYVHMGFHPAWKYETVFELTFSKGAVLERTDISQQMAELGDKMTRQPLQPGRKASGQEVEDWIRSTFKRNYRF